MNHQPGIAVYCTLSFFFSFSLSLSCSFYPSIHCWFGCLMHSYILRVNTDIVGYYNAKVELIWIFFFLFISCKYNDCAYQKYVHFKQTPFYISYDQQINSKRKQIKKQTIHSIAAYRLNTNSFVTLFDHLCTHAQKMKQPTTK